MERIEKNSLKLTHNLYKKKSIEDTILAFSGIALMDVKKNAGYTEIYFKNIESEDVILEFANYALSLTIQA